MDSSGTTLSTAITAEQAVRNAYQQTSPRRRFLVRWQLGTGLHRGLQVGGILVLTFLVVYVNTQSANWILVDGLLVVSALLLATGTLGSERKIFGEHFQAYGAMLNTRKGEPSRLRYLYFIDLIRANDDINALHIERLIPAIESRISYRDYFFRRFPVLTVLSAIIAMLTAAGIAQPGVWSTPLGVHLLFYASIFWVMAFFFGREWRSLRPNREAQERELITFLHMATLDLPTITTNETPLRGLATMPQSERS